MDRRDDRELLEAAKENVAMLYGWHRLDHADSRQFYARDRRGRILWLKARTKYDGQSPSWDWTNERVPYDDLIGILISPTGDLLLVMRASRELVEKRKAINKESYRFRWNAENAALVEILWTVEPFDL